MKAFIWLGVVVPCNTLTRNVVEEVIVGVGLRKQPGPFRIPLAVTLNGHEHVVRIFTSHTFISSENLRSSALPLDNVSSV